MITKQAKGDTSSELGVRIERLATLVYLNEATRKGGGIQPQLTYIYIDALWYSRHNVIRGASATLGEVVNLAKESTKCLERIREKSGS